MKKVSVQIKPPNIQTAVFEVVGTAPLVIHRFSVKSQIDIRNKMEAGSTAKKGKKREAVNTDDIFNEARYISAEGWDGFNASCIRHAMISVCRLVDYAMTMAKLSIFVVQDGWDKKEPQIPLIRIYGKPVKCQDWGRVDNGKTYLIFRPMYNPWSAKIKIRYDADQFTISDVTNLLARAGAQNGIGEGRPNSKKGPGMGWGTFEITKAK